MAFRVFCDMGKEYLLPCAIVCSMELITKSDCPILERGRRGARTGGEVLLAIRLCLVGRAETNEPRI